MSHHTPLPDHLVELVNELILQCTAFTPSFELCVREGKHDAICPHKHPKNQKCKCRDHQLNDCTCRKSVYVGKTPQSKDRRVSTYSISTPQGLDWIQQMKDLFNPTTRGYTRENVLLKQQLADEGCEPKKIVDAVILWVKDRESTPHKKNTLKIFYSTAGLNRKTGKPNGRGLLGYAKAHGLEWVSELTTPHLTTYRTGWRGRKGEKQTGLTMVQKQTNLVNFFSFCIRQGWIEKGENPAGGVGNPEGGLSKITREDRTPCPGFTPEQYQSIREACSRLPVSYECTKDVPLQVLALIELMRWSSFAPIDALKLPENMLTRDADGEYVLGNGRQVVRRKKTGKATGGGLDREVGDRLRAMVKHYPVRNVLPGYFFNDGSDDEQLRNKWYYRVKDVFALCDPPLVVLDSYGKQIEPHPYMFRHTFAIEHLESNYDIHALAKLMGNTVEEIERSYVDYSPRLRASIIKRQRESIAAQRAALAAVGAPAPAVVPPPAPPTPVVEITRHPHHHLRVASSHARRRTRG